MAWAELIVAGTAALGAAAIYSERIRRRGHRPPADRDRAFLWRGHRIAYTTRSSARTLAPTPVVLVHSMHPGASSYEWRESLTAVAQRGSVFALDLLGFGASDRPALRYSPALYVSLLIDFLAEVVAAPAVIVAPGLAAAYAIAAADAAPERVAALVLVEPTGLVRRHRNPGRLGDLLRLPLLAIWAVLTARARVRRALHRAFAEPARITNDMIDRYHASATRPGSAHAGAALLARQLDRDIHAEWNRLTLPALICWGSTPRSTPLADLRVFRHARADVEGIVIEDSGDRPHEEQPDDFNALLMEFVAALPGAVRRGASTSVEHRAPDA
jgi:pimeloyl-ACP methyl ester carboxylesterase